MNIYKRIYEVLINEFVGSDPGPHDPSKPSYAFSKSVTPLAKRGDWPELVQRAADMRAAKARRAKLAEDDAARKKFAAAKLKTLKQKQTAQVPKPLRGKKTK